MPKTKEQKQQTREKILNSAAHLFCQYGYDAISIDDLMQDAKLTRGAFYAHFESKSDVYLHALSTAAANAIAYRAIPADVEGRDWLNTFVEGYLNLPHVREETVSCPMAFLISDVASREAKVKKAYSKMFKGFSQLILNHLSDDSMMDKQAMSIALSALLVGTVAIARTQDNAQAQEVLIESSKQLFKVMTQCQPHEKAKPELAI
ncbi:MAG: TetR/AcrR family transcriptional regulator [Gammaproteobacteria bacterium]|nr:TetR/AcrR family transcriptional regulator [Gammaproteobacteria bacterium]MDH5730548.1 TetR/AcrR family transcriptional regulator [Gammaproteobacteria bacterium]